MVRGAFWTSICVGSEHARLHARSGEGRPLRDGLRVTRTWSTSAPALNGDICHRDKQPVPGAPRAARIHGIHDPVSHARHALALVLAVAPAACGPAPERSYSTEDFELHTQFSEPLCEGDLDRWSAFAVHAEELLDTPLEPGLRVHVWDEQDWSAEPWCLARTSGCYAPGRHRIFTTISALQHELVHAVAEGRGSRNAFFSEGVATAFEGDPTSFGANAPVDNIELGTRMVDRFTAGHFTRWLWETREPALLLDLLSTKANAAAFEDIYGASLEEVQEQYFLEAPWSYPPTFFHELPLLPRVAEDYWEETVSLDCGRTDVYGRPGGTAAIRVLRVEQPGVYTLWTDADGFSISRRQHELIADAAGAEFVGRGDVPGGLAAWYAGGSMHTVELNVGEYELWVTDIGAELDAATMAAWAQLGPTPTLSDGVG